MQAGARKPQGSEKRVECRGRPLAHDRHRTVERVGACGKDRAQVSGNHYGVRGRRELDQSAVEVEEERPCRSGGGHRRRAPGGVRAWVIGQGIRAGGAGWLRIEPLAFDEACAAHDALLAPHHRDPFDRGLVSQVILHGMTIVTPDAAIGRYPAPVLW